MKIKSSLDVLPLISGLLMFLKESPSVLIFGYNKLKGDLFGDFGWFVWSFFKTF